MALRTCLALSDHRPLTKFLILDRRPSHTDSESRPSSPSFGLSPRGRPVRDASSSSEQEGGEPGDFRSPAKWVWPERVDGDVATRSGAGEAHRLRGRLHPPLTLFLGEGGQSRGDGAV